ncbi:M23 family metallopeptidase [Chelatococcus sp. GCM10030263]|uniref:M23 family metallopeptidase n=1 Tax=Chelatococcus sp. GCM10030263 TaxID=3273387 RepID=UPI00361CCE78
MNRRWNSREMLVGVAPPLNSAVERAAPLGHAVLNIRWLLATVLLASVAGGLLSGALTSAVGKKLGSAAAPVLVVPSLTHQEVAETGRGDRAASAHRAKTKATPVRVEQLNESGTGTRRFTHLFARLDQLEQEALEAVAIARPDQDNDPALSSHDAAAGPALRPISFVKARPRPPKAVTAYAELGKDPPSPAPVFDQPLNLSVVPRSPERPENPVHVVVARVGDTLPAILEALGDPAKEAEAAASALLVQGRLGDGKFAGGEVIKVLEERPDEGAAPPSVLRVTVEPPGQPKRAVARSDSGSYKPVDAPQTDAIRIDATSEDARNRTIGGGESLRDGLDALAKVNQLDQGVVDELVRLCGHDFDLASPLSASDSVDLLYSPDERGRPELDFVALNVAGQARRYYRFAAPDDGSTDFYDENGQSVTQFLLRKPVAAGRLGDGFGWRVHPILRDRRFHEGVDYAAPYGSAIVAAGAGAVEIIGQQWGYGKYIRIKHDLGYETTYAHVAGFPRGLKVGDRVRQGETIAYVGSTGLSTGPHLYYEVRINGHNVNPLRIKLAGGRVLSGNVLATFSQARQQLDQLVDASAIATASR